MENKPSLAEKISVMTAFESGAEIEAKYRGKWIDILPYILKMLGKHIVLVSGMTEKEQLVYLK